MGKAKKSKVQKERPVTIQYVQKAETIAKSLADGLPELPTEKKRDARGIAFCDKVFEPTKDQKFYIRQLPGRKSSNEKILSALKDLELRINSHSPGLIESNPQLYTPQYVEVNQKQFIALSPPAYQVIKEIQLNQQLQILEKKPIYSDKPSASETSAKSNKEVEVKVIALDNADFNIEEKKSMKKQSTAELKDLFLCSGNKFSFFLDVTTESYIAVQCCKKMQKVLNSAPAHLSKCLTGSDIKKLEITYKLGTYNWISIPKDQFEKAYDYINGPKQEKSVLSQATTSTTSSEKSIPVIGESDMEAHATIVSTNPASFFDSKEENVDYVAAKLQTWDEIEGEFNFKKRQGSPYNN